MRMTPWRTSDYASIQAIARESSFVVAPWVAVIVDDGPPRRIAQSPDQLLISCGVVRSGASDRSLFANERGANLVFDRLERACPGLFQPAGSVTLDYGDAQAGYGWMRRYVNTELTVIITGGLVEFVNPLRGGPAVYLGRESDWEKAVPSLSCWRRDDRYYAAVR